MADGHAPTTTLTAEDIKAMRARYLVEPTPLGRPRLTDPVRADMTRLLDALEAATKEHDEVVGAFGKLCDVLGLRTLPTAHIAAQRIVDRAMRTAATDRAFGAARSNLRLLAALVKEAGGELFVPMRAVDRVTAGSSLITEEDQARLGWVVRLVDDQAKKDVSPCAPTDNPP